MLRDIGRRIVGVLGTWDPAQSSEAFWTQLVDGSNQLVAHLTAHPDDLALMEAALSRAPDDEADAWLRSLMADGVRLGVIDSPLPPDLLVSVTGAVFDALDRWSITQLTASYPATATAAEASTIDASGALETLARLWGTPRRLRAPWPPASESGPT